MQEQNGVIIPDLQALILRNTSKMGVLDQDIATDVADFTPAKFDRELSILNRVVAEDYSDTDSLILLSSAESINGLAGKFILVLTVENLKTSMQGFLTIRQARLTKRRDHVTLNLTLKGEGLVVSQWAYTRHPALRKLFVPMYDDPESLLDITKIEYTVLAGQAESKIKIASEWKVYEFSLLSSQIEQSRVVDQCEQVLEALDNRFSINEDQHYNWSQTSLILHNVDAVASALENEFLAKGQKVSYNIMVNMSGRELIRNKRIRPLVRWEIVTIDEKGTRRAATVGASVSD